MNRHSKTLLILALLGIPSLSYSQGAFGNLGFEQASTNSPISISGWTLYSDTVFYDTVSLGGAAISLHDSASLFLQPLEGNYSVLLQGSGAGPAVSAAIGQTGQIPTGSVSLLFWARANPNLQITIGGTIIPISRVGSTPGYDVFGGDITAFAGQTAELRFTGPANGGGYFDNIQFSNQPIPEPGTISLLLVGLGFAAFRRWKTSGHNW